MKTLFPNCRFLLPVWLLVLVPFFDVQACGPDFRPDTFVRQLRPDDYASYARGQLSLLQPTYFRRDLIVAYRYLIGGKLSDEEVAAYAPPSRVLTEAQLQAEEAARPTNQWNAERAKYKHNAPDKDPHPGPKGQTQSFPNPDNVWRYDGDYLNCPDDAFQTAVLTLRSRAKTFGVPSPALSDWLDGQDAVFSNCTGNTPAMPVAVSASGPALLRADRDYQIAAANFYAMHFPEAERGFTAISKDASSPWRTYGDYLAARCLVRQAFLSKPPDSKSQQTSYDLALLQQAQQRLESLLRDPGQAKMHHAIQAELNFVLLRTEQEQQVRALAAALAGPKPDPDFNQNLIDLTLTLDQHLDQTALRGDTPDYQSGANTPLQRSQAFLNSAALRGDSPLIDWLLTFQSPSEDAHQYALQLWSQTKTLPWLTAAIVKATAKDAAASELLDAAVKVPETSPAYTTITFHRARLLIGLNRQDEARRLLDEVLPGIRKAGLDSATNAFLGLRMQTARTLPEFLTYAPRKMLEVNSQAAGTANCYGSPSDASNSACTAKLQLPEFDIDAAAAFNFQFPLDLLIAAAKAPELPENLRQAIAISAWVRSVQLDDAAAAAQLAPLLPKTVEQTAGTSIGFPAVLAMLRNPGMQPYLVPGVPRALTYDVLDNYRDNWWCGDWSKTWSSGGAYGTSPPVPAVAVPFLTEADKSAAAEQSAKLLAMTDSGSIYLGQRVLAYGKDHPDDPNVPEALALTVRATHFGCSTQELEAKRLAMAKAAFQLLHRRYPDSTWAKKTKVYS